LLLNINILQLLVVIEEEAVLAVAEEIFGQGGRFGGSTWPRRRLF